MHDAARIEYDTLARIGDPATNAALLDQLEAKKRAGSAIKGAHLFRANLLRRCGDLSGAREAVANHLNEIGGQQNADPLDPGVIIPPGLRTKPDNIIAPLMVIDDLLSASDMAALHRHACDLEAQFRKARLSREGNPYDSDKRETLLTWSFDCQRQFFIDFIEQNLARFQANLGLPPFALERSEIKLTNHLDGGFFNTHRDNHSPAAEAGRALTWLYYFGATPPRFSGGDLFIIDSNPSAGEASENYFTKITPQPNRFVAFPSWFYHAVGPTQVSGNAFADGRFAVSGHVHKPADTLDWQFL